MTRTSRLPLRPAILLALALSATALVLILGLRSTEAGGANSLAISPTEREVGVGGSTSVQLVSMPPAESLAVWVIDVVFDPAVVSVNSCTSIPNPPGSVGVSHCEASDQTGGPDEETIVAVGAYIFPGTELGLTQQSTLATISFMAVGNVGDCSDLTISFDSHAGPDPEAENTDPAITNGEICIVEEAGTDRIWADTDCSGEANPIDSLKVLRYDAGLVVNQPAGCPQMGAAVTVDGEARTWADNDCSGEGNPIDSLKVLRFDAGLAVNQPAGCPAMGALVNVAD